MAKFPKGMFLVVPIPEWDEESKKWRASYRIITSDEPRIILHHQEKTEEGYYSKFEAYWADAEEGFLYWRESTRSGDCDGQTSKAELHRVRIEQFTEESYAIKSEEYQEPGNPFLKWEVIKSEFRDHQGEAANF